MSEQIYNPAAAAKAQNAYCEAKKLPRFAPFDGRCWRCNNQIYAPCGARAGITVQEAGSCHVTYCPHCHRAFDD